MVRIFYIALFVRLISFVLIGSLNSQLDAELLEMIERADSDGDGEISPEEFYSIMTKKTFT